MRRPRHPQPLQPLVWDGRVLRFQANALVRFIVEQLTGPPGTQGAILCKDGERLDFNALMAMPWSDADRDQFNMLHGYSVSGLPYRSRKTLIAADELARQAIAKRYPGSSR